MHNVEVQRKVLSSHLSLCKYLTDDHVDRLRYLPRVVARCSPATKVKLIEALHRRGKIVGEYNIGSYQQLT